ncbi:MAG: hypothetical protein AAGC69_07290, partial [Paracraurococcus sp.]
NVYQKGKEPLPFDLLFWNSDSTRMPAANHSFYLRHCYLQNDLAEGRMEIGGSAMIEVPASALTRAQGDPAVWVVDPATQTVALRPIEVVRFDPARVLVGQGLETGDIVVTAGVQALRPGQKVRLLGQQAAAR